MGDVFAEFDAKAERDAARIAELEAADKAGIRIIAGLTDGVNWRDERIEELEAANNLLTQQVAVGNNAAAIKLLGELVDANGGTDLVHASEVLRVARGDVEIKYTILEDDDG